VRKVKTSKTGTWRNLAHDDEPLNPQLYGGRSKAAARDEAFRRAILAIPPGRVSTYGAVAAAAGYPRYHRAVARLLHQDNWDRLPWHRVLGADGKIKTCGVFAREQRARLRLEGVSLKGDRVDMSKFSYHACPESGRD
jgi:methylated-DNA-protein-cysteine methyltransferase-like protein